MNLIEYAHIKKAFINKVVKAYLQGFSIEEICIKVGANEKDIDNIIDCYNYLNN